jgi:hypothetical protein
MMPLLIILVFALVIGKLHALLTIIYFLTGLNKKGLKFKQIGGGQNDLNCFGGLYQLRLELPNFKVSMFVRLLLHQPFI